MSQSREKPPLTHGEALDTIIRNGGNPEKIATEVIIEQVERILEHETKHIANRIPVETKRFLNQIKNLFRRKR